MQVFKAGPKKIKLNETASLCDVIVLSITHILFRMDGWMQELKWQGSDRFKSTFYFGPIYVFKS